MNKIKYVYILLNVVVVVGIMLKGSFFYTLKNKLLKNILLLFFRSKNKVSKEKVSGRLLDLYI